MTWYNLQTVSKVGRWFRRPEGLGHPSFHRSSYPFRRAVEPVYARMAERRPSPGSARTASRTECSSVAATGQMLKSGSSKRPSADRGSLEVAQTVGPDVGANHVAQTPPCVSLHGCQ